jgi:hypothetical protein
MTAYTFYIYGLHELGSFWVLSGDGKAVPRLIEYYWSTSQCHLASSPVSRLSAWTCARAARSCSCGSNSRSRPPPSSSVVAAQWIMGAGGTIDLRHRRRRRRRDLTTGDAEMHRHSPGCCGGDDSDQSKYRRRRGAQGQESVRRGGERIASAVHSLLPTSSRVFNPVTRPIWR